MYTRVHLLLRTCRDQKTAYRNEFFSTLDPRIKLESSGLVASAFTC